MSDNVVPLKGPRPKRENHTHMGQKYVLTYNMKDKTWKWSVYINKTYHFSGECKDKPSAMRSAKSEIEKWEN